MKLYTSDKENVEIEIVYTSDQKNVEIEIAYASGQKMLKSKKFTLLLKYTICERLRENKCLLCIFEKSIF